MISKEQIQALALPEKLKMIRDLACLLLADGSTLTPEIIRQVEIDRLLASFYLEAPSFAGNNKTADAEVTPA